MSDTTTTTTSTIMKNSDHQDEVAQLSSTEEAAPESSSSSSSSKSTKETSSNKRNLRAVMVSCIDSALEELGPIDASALARFEANPLPVPHPATASASRTESSKTLVADSTTPTAESLYGPSSPSLKFSPNLLRGGIPRRYQRRNSVTKFSLSCALKEVQQDDPLLKPQLTGSMTNRQLWHQLYNKHPITGMKSATGSFEMPSSAKRRRGGLA